MMIARVRLFDDNDFVSYLWKPFADPPWRFFSTAVLLPSLSLHIQREPSCTPSYFTYSYWLIYFSSLQNLNFRGNKSMMFSAALMPGRTLTLQTVHIIKMIYVVLKWFVVTCPKCEHGRAYFMQIQIRSADEPSSIFYKCCNQTCNHQWREG